MRTRSQLEYGARGFSRRHLLCCSAALGAGLFTSLLATPARALSFREGLRNPCLGTLPPALARHELVLRAFDGIDATALWDVHAHLLGTGDSGSGCTVNARMNSWWNPAGTLRRRMILNAACVNGEASIDAAYVARLLALANDFPAGARFLLYAFEHACDDEGEPNQDWTSFHVPNAYAANVAAAHPQRFAWVASVHPYRRDALHRLDDALDNGSVAMKWLPSAMNIDLRDRRCRAFYERLAAARLPLIVHCGAEQAVPGAGRDDLGNPLFVRVPLEHGVRVVVAHAASLGGAHDLDQPSQPLRAAFELWTRVMDEPAWRERLHADISAVFQANRDAGVWRAVLERDDWHARLLHGSDYPLPGVMPLYAPARLADEGLLEPAAVEPLRSIRAHNPLLFDFVLKRSLRAGGNALPRQVFETRSFFTAGKRA